MKKNSRYILNSLFLFVFMGQFLDADADADPGSWQCGKMQWVSAPSLEQGVYQGRLESDCRLVVSSPDIRSLHDAIELTLFTRSEFLSPPEKIKFEGLTGQKFDVKNQLDHDGDRLVTVEDIILATDEKSRLLYYTRSRSVKGEGMASYLRGVEFNAKFQIAPDAIQLKMENAVRVERPWYALAPIFKWIAGNVSRSKFDEIKNRLLPFFSKNLDQTT